MNAYRQNRRASQARRAKQRRLFFLASALLVLLAIFFWLHRGSGISPSSDTEAVQGGTTGLSADSSADPQLSKPATIPAKPSFETLAFPAQSPVPARTVVLPVMMFHHVGPTPQDADETRIGLTVSTADFEAMMSYLQSAGYQTVTPSDLFKALFEGTALPPHPVMLTFDDGYLDNYQTAVPIIEKYGLRATINIIVEKLGAPGYMSWDQVTELDGRGIVIGSHTMSHPDLTTLSAADLKQELSGSAQAISSHLGHPVYWICYPSGKYDSDVIRYARQAGYLLGLTTNNGEKQSSDSPLEIKRYRVRNDTGLKGFQELVR